MEGTFKLWYKELLRPIQEDKGNAGGRKEKEGYLMLGKQQDSQGKVETLLDGEDNILRA